MNPQQFRLVRAPQQFSFTPQTPKKGGRGGTLTSLISEGGAIGGGAAGAAIGTGILPGIGTLLGGALGAGIGAFGGRVAENQVRDSRFGFGDAAKEAGLSALLGGGPLRLGKAALAARRGGTGLTEALKASTPRLEAGEVAKNSTLARTSVPGKLDEMANKMLTSQYGTISKPVARAASPEKTFSKLAALGITKPSDVERVSSAITGTNGLLNKAVVKAAGDSSRVDVSDLRQIFTDAMENNGVVGTKQKELTAMFDAQMKKLLGGPRGSLDPTAHPSDVLDVMKSFEKRIAQKTGKGSNYRLATDETTNQANALRLVTDELQSRLESGAHVKGVLTPELRNKLISLHPNNEAWQKYVDNNIMKSKDVKSLRSAQSPFVNAKKIIDEADLNSMTFGGRVGNNANLNLRDAFVNAVVGPFKNPARRATSSALKTASKASQNLPSVPLTPGVRSIPAGLKIGVRSQVGEGLASALLNSQSSSEKSPVSSGTTLIPLSEDLNSLTASQSTSAMPMNNSIMDTSYTKNVDMSTSPLAPENLQNSIQQILANGGQIEDAIKFVSLAEALQKLNPSASQTSFSDTAIKNITDVQSGIQQLQGLRDQLSSSVGGPLAGRLRALNPYDTEFQAQQANINRVRQIVGKALEGGVLRKEDEEKYKKILPVMTDTPEVAQAKIDAIMQQLQSNLEQYVQFQSQTGKGAGQLPTDLASALAANGY